MLKKNVKKECIVNTLHPKMCKRIIHEGLCQFGGKCAYSHYTRSNLQGVGNDHAQEEVNILKAEVFSLKNTLNSLISIREEGEHMQNYIRDIKVEIYKLTNSNRELSERLISLEKHTIREKGSSCELVKQVNESPMKKRSDEFKCDTCKYSGKSIVSLNNHMNTKHVHEQIDFSNKKESECVSECIDDLFQMEFVEGEQVYACNVCNKGFDKSEEMKTHIEKEHKDILIQIGKDINEDDESESDSSNDESYGEAWLAKYDSDGNFTG